MSAGAEERHATHIAWNAATRSEAGAWQAQRWLFVAHADRDHGDFLIKFHFIRDIYIILILVCYYRYTVKWHHE